jgi:intraflagellar transport protein 81
MTDFKREQLLSVLYFLVKDLDFHKKRAYLALYLSPPEYPPEFSHDPSNIL